MRQLSLILVRPRSWSGQKQEPAYRGVGIRGRRRRGGKQGQKVEGWSVAQPPGMGTTPPRVRSRGLSGDL